MGFVWTSSCVFTQILTFQMRYGRNLTDKEILWMIFKELIVPLWSNTHTYTQKNLSIWMYTQVAIIETSNAYFYQRDRLLLQNGKKNKKYHPKKWNLNTTSHKSVRCTGELLKMNLKKKRLLLLFLILNILFSMSRSKEISF